MGATVPGAAIPAPRRRAPWIAAAALAIVAAGTMAVWWQSRTAVPVTTAAATTASTSKPTAEVRPPAPTVAATPTAVVAVPPTPAVTPPITAAPPTLTLAPQPLPTAIPTGANNAAAQEALLLASIVPIPALASARPPESAKSTAPEPTSAATSTARKVEASTSSSTPTSAAPTAAAPPPKESAKERRAREAKEREVKERELRLAAAAPVIVATGTVRIAISPWGNVEVDGTASGAAPPLTQLTLAEGRHQIVVRNGDFAPFVATINVVAGQTTSIRHKFGSGG